VVLFNSEGTAGEPFINSTGKRPISQIALREKREDLESMAGIEEIDPLLAWRAR